MGQVALALNDCAAAAGYTQEALSLFDARGQRWTASLCLDMLSQIADAQGQPEREVCLLAAAMVMRDKFGFAIPPAERDAKNERIAEMWALTGAHFDAAWTEGQAFSWEEVIAYAQSGAA